MFWMHAATAATLATIVSSWLLRTEGFGALRILALLCGLSALVLMFAPMHTLKRFGDAGPGGSYMQTTRVVNRGPFSIVRHPQYVGYVLLNATFALIAQHWVVVSLAAVAGGCFYLHARAEERAMCEKFGETYRNYMQQVPRFDLFRGTWRALRRGTPR
jgi:protein-S-isoprenylcysteine O-methyltransferase Ste14